MKQMKKHISITGFLLILILFVPDVIMAQGKIELTPFGGYMFGGRMRFYEGDLKIQDNANYGLAMDVEIANNTKLELFWNQMMTTAEFRPFYGYESLRIDPFDVNVGYIQIGSVREVDYDNIRPFIALTLGTAYFSPQDTQYKQTWKFAASLGGGAKIWLSDRVGIRLQGRLLMPMFWGGVGFTVGTGGSGFTVGAGSSMIQGDLTGGLIIALGD
jgi:hypothetical protein